MYRYNVQARQFEKTMLSGVVRARSRQSAINKFKKDHIIKGGYYITAKKEVVA